MRAVFTTMSFSNVLDTNKYEDISREFLGTKAFLLFQLDKLVNSCTKYLVAFNQDPSCKATKRMFDEFHSTRKKNENQYIANFYKLANRLSSKALQLQIQVKGGNAQSAAS